MYKWLNRFQEFTLKLIRDLREVFLKEYEYNNFLHREDKENLKTLLLHRY